MIKYVHYCRHLIWFNKLKKKSFCSALEHSVNRVGCDSDSLEVARRADIGLRQLLLLAFGFLVLPAQAAVAQHVVDVI